ncbi:MULTISPECIES: lasso peptide biosynthesis B2 protein [Cyanobacteriota]|uniref:Lasso peptide biosynthesis B2 protein n=1 Tax=Adonisia turfae CCMR0081 TaxID=2292702 RepID=A0A6M0RGD0_9CYAN|nr:MULTISPECIES: lasso peptide biosynthesis B2 protein [Cyanobacteriota]MDV3348225.1 lasso peptide biosynthesis B2 protein [Leptothoe sp. LEGE 181152]NEZ55288.1 lasso peptide biosynthesis B2 protein [Adonisia turfae CCMR0081]
MATQFMLLEATVLLALSRCAVLVLPLRLLGSCLGHLNCETPKVCTGSHQLIAQQIATAITMVSPYTPWRSNCLAQAISGKLMLRMRGISSTLYLGLSNEGTQLAAHAWLRVGEQTITGGAIAAQYQVVAFYGK